MNDVQFTSELSFELSLSIAKKLLADHVISDKEFQEIRMDLLKQYQPVLGGLLSI